MLLHISIKDNSRLKFRKKDYNFVINYAVSHFRSQSFCLRGMNIVTCFNNSKIPQKMYIKENEMNILGTEMWMQFQ